jgi:hypothetical protein
VLIGPCAAGAAVAAGWVQRVLLEARGRRLVALAAGLLTLAAVPWLSRDGAGLGPFDLLTVPHGDLAHGLAADLPWAIVAAPVAVVYARWRADLGSAARRAVGVLPPFLLAALVATPTLVLAHDAHATAEWTYSRQNLSALAGRSTCGLADSLQVPDPASMVGFVPVQGHAGWYRIPRRHGPFGFFISADRPLSLTVLWGRSAPVRVRVLARGSADLSAALGPDAARARLRFVSQPPTPDAAHGADVVSLLTSPRQAKPRISGPIAYSLTPFRKLVDERRTRTLVSPFVREAIPCARQPVVKLGAGEAPALIVEGGSADPALAVATSPTGPFGAIPNVFEVRRLLLVPEGAQHLAVYQVQLRPGDGLLPAAVIR